MSYESFIIITISLLLSTGGRRQATLIYGVLKILAKKKKTYNCFFDCMSDIPLFKLGILFHEK